MTTFKRVTIPGVFTKHERELRPLDKDILRVLGDLSLNLEGILNRGITFNENVATNLLEFTSNGVADVENTVAHGLGKVPTGFIVYSVDKAGVVYKGATAWTTTNIYLKVNVATVAVKVLAF